MHYVMPLLVVFVMALVIFACWQKSSSVKRKLPKAKQFLMDHFSELSASNGLANRKTIAAGLATFPKNRAEIEFLLENIGGIGHVYTQDGSRTAKAAATMSVAASAPQLAGVSATASVASSRTVYVISMADLDAEHEVDFLGSVSRK